MTAGAAPPLVIPDTVKDILRSLTVTENPGVPHIPKAKMVEFSVLLKDRADDQPLFFALIYFHSVLKADGMTKAARQLLVLAKVGLTKMQLSQMMEAAEKMRAQSKEGPDRRVAGLQQGSAKGGFTLRGKRF